MKPLRTRVVVYGLIILLGLLSALPSFLPQSTAQKLPNWYTNNSLALGLDLQGGSHLLFSLDSEVLIEDEYTTLADELRRELRRSGIAPPEVVISPQGLTIEPTNPDRLAEIRQVVQTLDQPGPDGLPSLDTETSAKNLTVQFTAPHRDQLIDGAIEQSLEIVRLRLNETGLVEPSVTRQGSDGILVQMPGLAEPSEIRSLLGTTAKLTFHWIADHRTPEGSQTLRVASEQGTQPYRVEKRELLGGKHVVDAEMAFSPDTGQPVVHFRLDGVGADIFAAATRDNIGRALAIVLDEKVITAPVIRGLIGGGSGEISGDFTPSEAARLALLLRAGALPAPLDVIEERSVGPELGSDSLAAGLVTGLLGAALVVAFMVGIYGRWGLIACVGLGINVVLVFAILSVLGATLTLPGVAGIILSIGMAVDANILINERIREETRKGRPAYLALTEGFRRAYGTILDSNLTTLIAVSLLFLFGSGPVRGFAVTIGIGLVTSLFTAISVTRLLMEWQVRRHRTQPLVIGGLGFLDRLSDRGVNVMRGRVLGVVLSAVLSLASIGLFIHPGLHYGIDFTGGVAAEVTTETRTVSDLRLGLAEQGLGQASIQSFGEDGRVLVRLAQGDALQLSVDQPVEALKSAIAEVAPDAEFSRVELVGPKVSGHFSDATILAILLAGAGMLCYLWVRFEYHFALAATLTIGLDLTKTLGFFALTGVEFNLTAVAALLALIGYSINDKVVVFDRVRETLRQTPDKPLLQVLNESISSTLTRTTFTSVTTFLALLPMAVAGGHAVASFALPMLFGIVIGTSSSILIAAPILYGLGQRRFRNGLAQLRPTREELQKQLDLIP